MKKRFANRTPPASLLFCAALAFLLAGCGSLIDMGSESLPPRRVYVNDAAANDSLPPSLMRQGVYFVMQPGKQYALRLGNASPEDRIRLYNEAGNYVATLTGSAQDGAQSFALPASTRPEATLFLAHLQHAGAAPPASVRLVSADTTQAAGIAVKLLLIRQLPGLSVPANAAFAEALLAELTSIYAAYGVTLQTSYEFIEPTAAPLDVDFSSFAALPGDESRAANTLHLYLVNSISISSGSAGGTILGFAPREAVDLSSNTQSRVLLSADGGGTANAIALTAAHEMGHFLGLRHTTATDLDLSGDDDESNRDDGFSSTAFCSSVSKRAAGDITLKAPWPSGRPYCLRIAAASCPSSCGDLSNLMFPYGCSVAGGQKVLGADQRIFIRRNLQVLKP